MAKTTDTSKTASSTKPEPRSRKTKSAEPTHVIEPASSSLDTSPKGKLGVVVALLRRPEGATLEALVGATGWQAHSVRGVMSGALKKKLGLAIGSVKTEAGRVYRIQDQAQT